MVKRHSSDFSARTFNPLRGLKRVLNPFRHSARVMLRGARLDVRWTARAERELERRGRPLTVEMQLYFSCMVKKRVLFSEGIAAGAVPVDERLSVMFRTVEAASCDPIEFAASFPARRVLESPAAGKMRARELRIDFRHGGWVGEFLV